MSLITRTGNGGLNKVLIPPSASKLLEETQLHIKGSSSPETRRNQYNRIKQRIHHANIAQRAEQGLVERLFFLLDGQGTVIKRVAMTEDEARRRNESVRELGYRWTR